MHKRVIAMRGVSGSGKSSLARRLAERERDAGRTARIVSADDFFMEMECRFDASGEPYGEPVYKFDPTKIGEAHASCMGHFLDALFEGVDVVIVDNTHTRLWELENYRLAAKLAVYEFEVIELKATTIHDVKLFAARNMHGVPEMVVAQMAMQYEALPA